MRIIHRYLTNDYLITFLITVSLFTFVMTAGALVKAIDLLARGISGAVILKFFLLNVPYMLMFSIPMSALTAVLLLFGRLSIDGEITAMRACGLSMWQIISPVIMLSIAWTGLCVYINSVVAPESHFARRQALVDVGVTQPINLLEPGRFVRLARGTDEIMVYVGRRSKDKVNDVVVYELNEGGVKMSLRAESGVLRPGGEDEPYVMYVDLFNVRIDRPDSNNPLDPTETRYGTAGKYPVKMDFSKLLKRKNIRKKTSDMTFMELTRNIRQVRDLFPDLPEEDLIKERMKMVVEANMRLSLSISCFAFTLLGIPLGMKSRRRESSRGIGLSLLIVFLFYFFIIIAESLAGRPELRPDLIIWIPVILAELLGFWLIQRLN